MGCRVSKSTDTVASVSADNRRARAACPEGDHGSLLPGSSSSHPRNQTKLTKASGGPLPGGDGGTRQVPRSRTFLDSHESPASDPAKLRELENSAPLPLLGQPGYLAHSARYQHGGAYARGAGGVTEGEAGGAMLMEIEELQGDWEAALGRRSGTKVIPTLVISSRATRSAPLRPI